MKLTKSLTVNISDQCIKDINTLKGIFTETLIYGKLNENARNAVCKICKKEEECFEILVHVYNNVLGIV
jgi:hypothetical protein